MHSIYQTIPAGKLRRLYEDKQLPIRSIARMYRCDSGVIARALRKHRITIRHPTAPVSFDGKDLYALYWDKKLSTYKIAMQYGCDPKTVYRHLRLNNIPTRCRKQITITKETLHRLYIHQHKSLSNIAKAHGYSATGILKKLKQYSIKRRSLSETSTKHQKIDFNGDRKEKAYMIGFRIGDLGIRKKGNLICVSSGTTKTAQSKLIEKLFLSYGPVWIGKRNKHRAWNISCSLNRSFSFLLPKHARIPQWIQKSNSSFFSFLAGYTDAEGNIYISDGRAKFRLRTYDKSILHDIHMVLKRAGIRSLFGLDRKAGINKRGVKQNKDCWSLSINERRALSRLLTILLPILRHEKRKKDAGMAMKNVTKRIATQRLQ